MRAIDLPQVRNMLSDVLTRAESLNLLDGSPARVTVEQGVTGWRISDPDNVAYLFLPVSKGLGKTKAHAWSTLHAIREVLFAVAVRHPEIVNTIEGGEY